MDIGKNILVLLPLMIKADKMGTILLEDMEFYAYHGCFKEEQVIGNRFVVQFEINADTEGGELNDDLSKTLNYQEVYQIVDEQMQIKSNLLEHVARRIIDIVVKQFRSINYAKIKISKKNPPLGGKVEAVSVVLERHSGEAS